MPIQQPRISWEYIRNYTELYSYQDPRTGVVRKSFNPPKDAKFKQQVPYHVTAITGDGNILSGEVITLRINRRRRQRLVKFKESGECRWLRDYLIVEINGVRFVTY